MLGHPPPKTPRVGATGGPHPDVRRLRSGRARRHFFQQQPLIARAYECLLGFGTRFAPSIPENVPLGFRPALTQVAGPREAVQAPRKRKDTRRDKSPGDWLGQKNGRPRTVSRPRAPLPGRVCLRSIPGKSAQLPGKFAFILLQEIARLEKNNFSQQSPRETDLRRRSRHGRSSRWASIRG